MFLAVQAVLAVVAVVAAPRELTLHLLELQTKVTQAALGNIQHFAALAVAVVLERLAQMVMVDLQTVLVVAA
jgi:hypothetical protein